MADALRRAQNVAVLALLVFWGGIFLSLALMIAAPAIGKELAWVAIGVYVGSGLLALILGIVSWRHILGKIMVAAAGFFQVVNIAYALTIYNKLP